MSNTSIDILVTEAIDLLKELIQTPSFSKQEDQTAGVISRYLAIKGVPTTRVKNNVFCVNSYFDDTKPTVLLNSHHDTVKPNSGYTKDPYLPIIEEGKLYGLGSNDAGGPLVSLIAAFLYYFEKSDLKYNLILAATAEEEISGADGIEYTLPLLPKIDFAIVGEPTLMQMAVAERGLMVLDATAHGKPGHAARNEGVNAIYKALKDIEWFATYQFKNISPLLGPVQMNVTVINTENKAHNVVPALCTYVVDVRVNELYTFEEVINTIKENVQSDIKPRSTRLRSTSIAMDHSLVKGGISMGLSYYGSPTTSDKALMLFPALKLGPGDSARSHSADEFIYVEEIKKGIELYIQLLNHIV
ncbi:MAG TPA: M20 family metallo-hydrolase [Chitinophagaceae bacterium]|nr:M20 family metallo-hydrolase [Chitinophagaceae bacterium]